MNINEILELDYLVEEVSNSDISYNKKPGSVSESYVTRNLYVFDPNDTGLYEFEVGGSVVEVDVTDFYVNDDFDNGSLNTSSDWNVVVNNGSISESGTKLNLNCNSNGSSTTINSQNLAKAGATLEANVEIDGLGDGKGLEIGFRDQASGSEYIWLEKDRGRSGWELRCYDGSNSIRSNIGDIGTGPHSVKIEWDPGSSATLYIDGSQVAQITNYVPTSDLPVHLSVNNGAANSHTDGYWDFVKAF